MKSPLPLMLQNVCHIGVSQNVNGGISSVLSSYKKNFDLPSENFWCSYNGSFVRSLPLVLRLCLRILFCSDRNFKGYQLHMSSYGSFFRAYAIAFCLYLRKKKYVVHTHGSELQQFCEETSSCVKKMIRGFFKRASGIIAITENMKDFLNGYVGENLPVFVIPNPCDSIADSLVEKSEGNECVKIVFSGQYGKRKGVYDLLDAFDKCNFHTPVELHLFGNGEVEQVRSRALSLKKSKSVFVSGWTEHEAYLKKLPSFDFLVLPSYAETFGMSLVEAMGQGLPVVSTFSGGIPNVVDNGRTGILINAGDVDALKSALETMVENSQIRKEMGLTAWKDVSEKYTVRIVLEQLENMYTQICSESC